jgi:nitrile hydratase
MNGVHDMGGMQGFGPILLEVDEPVFHADWERRAFALTVAMGFTGEWTIDMGRHARENRHPADYLTKTYYELWLSGLARLLAERGLVGEDEIAAGHALHSGRPVKQVLKNTDVESVLARGTRYERPAPEPARFAVGDRVRARSRNPEGHTRLPRYVRGHVGRIERINGFHVFPDVGAAGVEAAHWLYTVRFSGRELWDADGDPDVDVSVDAWEPYLEPHP